MANTAASAPTQAPAPQRVDYLTALRTALDEEMQRNPDMLILGEDIGILGGAFGVTDGLQTKYGKDRVIDMPISEAAIVGVSVGAALNGKTVVAEMQFIDFISCGFDQIVNNLATYYYRTAGDAACNVVIRGPAGAYGGGALYHSQMNESWFCHSPGLKVVCPSTPYDAKGLMRTALRDPNPVIFYEIKQLYRLRDIEEELPTEDYTVPFGQAAIRRTGRHITLVTYGQMVHMCLKAAELLAQAGFEAEVIDIRTLVPLDEATILESVKRTNRVLVVNEAPKTCGFAGELVARINEFAFEHLDAPPLRVTRMDTPVPWAKPLETFVLPSVNGIFETAVKLCRF